MDTDSEQREVSVVQSYVEVFCQRVRTVCQSMDPRWMYILPLILFSPSLFFGLIVDDYVHYWKFHFEQGSNSPLRAMDSMFVFFPSGLPNAVESSPWWLIEDKKLSFSRPLSAFTHWLDSVLWKDIFILHHLHSLIWACLCVWVVHRIYTRFLGRPVVLGILLFAVQDSHAFPNGWLANRNALIALVFGMLSFDAHLRWREERGRVVWPMLLFTLSMYSAEAGVCTLAFIGSWALFYEKDKRSIVTTLLPYLGIVILWRILYKEMGHGSFGFKLYVDPGTDTMAYIINVLKGLPVLLFNQWFKVPGEGMVMLPVALQGWYAVGCFVLVAVVCTVFWSTIKENKQLQFWSLAMVASLVPVSATSPQERLLLFCGVGFIGLLVGLFQHHKGQLAKWLLVLHLPLAIALVPVKLGMLKSMDLFLMGYESAPSDIQPEDQMIYLNGFEFVPMYGHVMPRIRQETAPSGFVLLAGATDFTLTKIDDYRLEMSIPKGWFAEGMPMLTPPETFTVGQRTTRGILSVEVLEITADGQPSRVLYAFENRLDHSNYRWMLWQGLHYEEIDIDFPIGEAIFFPNPMLEMMNQ